MSTRDRKEEKRYKKYRATIKDSGACDFCSITEKSLQFVSESKSFFVIKNIFPYTHWDGQGVLDHLLLIPKKHTDTVSDFSPEESIEYITIIGSYESHGYDIHARGPASNRKTVVHQHTHLIRLDRKHRRFLFYSQRPYIRITH